MLPNYERVYERMLDAAIEDEDGRLLFDPFANGDISGGVTEIVREVYGYADGAHSSYIQNLRTDIINTLIRERLVERKGSLRTRRFYVNRGAKNAA